MTKKQLDILQAARAWREAEQAMSIHQTKSLDLSGMDLSKRQDARARFAKEHEENLRRKEDALDTLRRAVDASNLVNEVVPK